MVFYGVRLKKAERSPERQDEVQTAMLRTPLCPQCCWREAGSCGHGDTAPPALTALTRFPSPLQSAAASGGSQGPLCPPALLQPQERACPGAMPPCRALYTFTPFTLYTLAPLSHRSSWAALPCSQHPPGLHRFSITWHNQHTCSPAGRTSRTWFWAPGLPLQLLAAPGLCSTRHQPPLLARSCRRGSLCKSTK